MPTRRPLPASLVFLVAAAPFASAASPEMSAKVVDDSVVVERDGAEFARLNLGFTFGRPYWHPIHTPNGVLVSATRPGDHKHHTGIYIGVEHVNGLDYWGSKDVMQAEKVPAEDVPGKVANREVAIPRPNGTPVQVRIVNAWIGKEGTPVLHETTTVDAHANGLFSFDIELEAVAEEVEFLDTKEGFFAFRFREELTGKSGNGKIVNPAGEEGESASWGKTNHWLDYYGTADGKTAGVALFDHPQNFRPSRYHVRAYGLFAVSPFGEGVYSKGESEAKPVHLKKGEKLRLRYAAYVHDGDTEQADVAGVYTGWAAGE